MFLDDREIRPVQLKDSRGFEILGLSLGQGPSPLEVLIARRHLYRPSNWMRSSLFAGWVSKRSEYLSRHMAMRI